MSVYKAKLSREISRAQRFLSVLSSEVQGFSTNDDYDDMLQRKGRIEFLDNEIRAILIKIISEAEGWNTESTLFKDPEINLSR